MIDGLLAWDNRLFFLVNNGLGRAWLDPFVLGLTWFGAWAVGVLAVAALASDGSRVLWRRHVPILLAGALLVGLANRGIKKAVRAPRPAKAFFAQLDAGSVEIRFLEKKIKHRKSFPSGHSLTAFYFMVYVACRKRRLAPWALLLASGIAVSRVYVGAHFPLDCLAGALLGGMGGWLAWKAFKYWEARPA